MGVAVIGQKVGPRRAALTGAILGTLPDLDVFLAPDDPIDAFVQHRGWSHSLLVHAALAPLIGEGLRHFFALPSPKGSNKPIVADATIAKPAIAFGNESIVNTGNQISAGMRRVFFRRTSVKVPGK